MTTFYDSYLQWIALSPDAPPHSFNSTEDYGKISLLGPALPKLPYAFPGALAFTEAPASGTVLLVVKSIRPPYKFSTSLEDTPLGHSVGQVKAQLAKLVDALSSANVLPLRLKLMVKSRVLSDTTVLSSLAQPGDSVSITVMVSAQELKAQEAKEEPAKESAEPAKPAQTVSQQTWELVQAALAKDIGEPAAAAAVVRFKTIL